MAMTNEQLTKWIDEIFGTIDEIKQNSGDITGLTRSVKQLREDLTATQADVTDLEDQTAGVVSLPKAALQHFTDGSATQALDLVADIIPIQAGTGDPAPDNVRAITGYSSVTAKTCRKNLFDKTAITDNAYLDTYDGVPMSGHSGFFITDFIPVHAGDSVYIPATGTARRWFYNTAKQADTYLNNAGAQVYEPTADGYIRVSVNTEYETADTLQIEIGTEASTYEAYQANTATLSLGSTVYSGDINPTTGVLSVNMDMLSSTGAESENWLLETLAENNNGFYISASGSVNITAQDAVVRGMCDIFKFISAAELNSHTDDPEYVYTCALLSSHNIYFLVPKTVATTVAEFKTWLASHNINALYQLETPTTTTLTPAQLQLLQGANNVSATSGPITLTYAPDNVLAEVYAYIQKRFDTLTASLAANRTTRKTTKTLTKKED